MRVTTLTGIGRVTLGADVYDDIGYRIEVVGWGDLMQTRGLLHARWPILAKLLDADDATLELRDGRLVRFFVTTWSAGWDYAGITAKAGVPGIAQPA